MLVFPLLAFSLTFPAHRRTFPYLIRIFLISSFVITPLEIHSSSLLRDPVRSCSTLKVNRPKRECIY